jgi:hypothetical protein
MNAASYRSREERHPRTTEPAYPPIFDLFSRSGIAAARWLTRSAFDPKGSSPYTARGLPELPASPDQATPFQVAQNDIVLLADNQGTWKVVAPVHGAKADIRRRATFDTRIVTVLVKHLRVVRRAGSPGCDY